MNAEDFRAQVRQIVARSRSPMPENKDQRGVCVPLRLSSAADMTTLLDLVQRVALSPALVAANSAGLLRFDLCIDPALSAGVEAVCCDACARLEPCCCGHAPAAAAAAVTPLFRGVVTERDIKRLPPDCRLVGMAPKCIVTPLARDALRQRGIAVEPAKGD